MMGSDNLRKLANLLPLAQLNKFSMKIVKDTQNQLVLCHRPIDHWLAIGAVMAFGLLIVCLNPHPIFRFMQAGIISYFVLIRCQVTNAIFDRRANSFALTRRSLFATQNIRCQLQDIQVAKVVRANARGEVYLVELSVRLHPKLAINSTGVVGKVGIELCEAKSICEKVCHFLNL
jgi:hypothetical protein